MSLNRFLPRPRYADVAATFALVVAMSGTAYAVTQIDPGSVYTGAIQNQAVTAPKLADEAVTNAKIAPAAVTGDEVLNRSLTLSDIAGAGATGPISFSLTAHRCGYLTFTVPGAKVGQVALMSWVGSTNPIQGVTVGPLKVVRTGVIVASACNATGHGITGHNVAVRVVTMG